MKQSDMKTAETKPRERLKTMMSTMASHMQERMSGAQEQVGSHAKADAGQVDQVLNDWPNPPQEVARKMMKKYGVPNEAMSTKLVWYNQGPWKRIEVQRDEIPHAFPAPHTDYITHFINYRVPPEMLADLARFDGSVLVDRTRGEAAARCDMESANILSLNLMHEIVTGKRTVADAREKFAEQTAAYMMNRSAPYSEKLLFEPPKGDTAYVDESVIGGDMLDQMAEKMKDVLGGDERHH